MKLFQIIIVGLCIVGQLQAQHKGEKDSTALSRELILEKEYNPSVRDAFKINVLPQIKEPEAPKAKIEYSNFTIPYNVKPEISLLNANSYFTHLNSSKKRGYVNLGIGTFVDANADAGYQILNTETNQLSIWGSHRSSNGKVDYLQSDKSQKMKINDTWGGVSYKGKSGFLNYFMDTKFTYSAYNYYGYTLLPRAFNELSNVDKNINQVSNILDISTGLASDRPSSELNYAFKADYSYFGDKYLTYNGRTGPKEHHYKLGMDLNKGMDDDKLIGFRGYFSGNYYTLDNDASARDFMAYSFYQDHIDVGLNPYFNIEGENWSARLGVLVDLLFDQSEEINIAPDIAFNFRPTEEVLLYLNAKGGVDDNTNRDIYRENRYVSPLHRTLNTYSSFDGTLGVKSTLESFWFDLFAGYKYAKQNYFYTQHFDYNSDLNSTYLGANFSVPEYYDGGVFKLGGDLKYKYTDNFEVGLKSVYYNWILKKEESPYAINPTPWNKPNFVTDLSMSYKLTQIPLKFDLIYHLETGRKATSISYAYNSMSSLPISDKEIKVVDMKNINQLNAQGTYTINDTFSIFGRVNNLLFQQYDLWYGYPAQEVNFMGGVNVKF